MSSSPKSSPGGAAKAPMFTEEGLPLHHPCFGAAPTASDVGDGGPARRVECRQPQLLSAPTIRPISKRPSSDAPRRRASAPLELPLDRSLIDDDDDEIVDYFSPSGTDAADASACSVPQDSAEAASSSTWAVRESHVPTLPSFYPLEKSAAFIPQASAPVLASRVASVLQARSIVASYDSKNAKVDCVSKGHVEFRIRLYRGRGEYSHGIIVEVQRRSGFDLSYTHDVYAILDAAEGKHSNLSPSYSENTVDSSGSDEEEDLDALENTAGLASLRVISDIVCPPGDDAEKVTVEGRDFALSSLASLTSLDHMGQAASKFSNELFTSEEYGNLRRAILSNIVQEPADETFQRPMLQSLEILANAAASSTQDFSEMAEFLSQDDHEVLAKLIVNIENAALNPRAADLSCAILKNVAISDVLLPFHKERLMVALENAKRYGEQCHAELEKNSRRCLELCM